jgi:hypothetical protein
VIADGSMAPLSESQRGTSGKFASTVIGPVRWSSLLAVARWFEQIDDPTISDGILDCLVHNGTASRCS